MIKIKRTLTKTIITLALCIVVSGCNEKIDSNKDKKTKNNTEAKQYKKKIMNYISSKQCKNNNAVYMAIQKGDINNIISLNIDYNCYIKEYDLIGVSMLLGKEKLVDFFLSKVTEINPAVSPILTASSLQNLDYIKLLFDKGFDLKVIDINGKTMSHYAAKGVNKKYNDEKSLEVLKYLVSKNININLADFKGVTPLHDAKTSIIAEYLFNNGADINFKDNNNWTPLHRASNNRKYEVAKFLVKQNDIDINAQEDYHNASSLHMAVDWSSLDIVKLLVENNIDKSLKNDVGLTALDIVKNKLQNSASEGSREKYQKIMRIIEK